MRETTNSKRNSLTGGNTMQSRVSPMGSKLAKTVKLQPKNTREELLITVKQNGVEQKSGNKTGL